MYIHNVFCVHNFTNKRRTLAGTKSHCLNRLTGQGMISLTFDKPKRNLSLIVNKYFAPCISL